MGEVLTFGRWLRRRRVALHLTQQELGRLAGCAADTIRKIEADMRRPSADVARLLAVALRIPEAEHPAFMRFARGTQFDVPPLPMVARSTGSRSPSTTGSLPARLTPLIGRDEDLRALCALLLREDVGLVTLTGVGGSGKTSLALSVAARLRADFADGAWFADLSLISDAGLVGSTIASTLQVSDVGGRPLLEHLKAVLHEQRLLLVLDNFEHVVDASPIVAMLLRSAPRLTVVATSRVALHLSGEHIYPVQPLALPAFSHLPSLDVLRGYPAVALFVERAQAVRPDFQLTEANAHAVAGICQRLDGLPLVLELAAARMAMFPPAALLQRLKQRLPFLTGGARDLPMRQRTLRGMIEWSHDLLEADERMVFRRLGVFIGGWTLAGAEAVCRQSDEDEPQVLEVLASLVDKNMVQHVLSDDEEPRFSMLETLREYAMEQLAASDEAAMVRERHAVYCVTFAESLERSLRSPRQVVWLHRFNADYPNFYAALEWCWEQHRIEDSVRLAVALADYWHLRGHFQDGAHWLYRLTMHQMAIDAVLRAKLVAAAGWFASNISDLASARPLLEEAVRLSVNVGDRWTYADALQNLASHVSQAEYATPALRAALEVDDPGLIADARMNGAYVWLSQGRWADALQELDDVVLMLRARGSPHDLYLALSARAAVLHHRGRYAEAASSIEEALAHITPIGQPGGIAFCLWQLALIEYGCGNAERAASVLGESLTNFRKAGNRQYIAEVLALLGRVVLMQGDDAQAEVWIAESRALADEIDNAEAMAAVRRAEAAFACHRRQYDRAMSHLQIGIAHIRRTHRWPLDGCLFMEELAGLVALQGDPVWAARLFGAAERLREAVEEVMMPTERMRYTRDLVVLRERLDEEHFAAAWSQGQAMKVDQVIAYTSETKECRLCDVSQAPDQ